jgi:hypothetical protein
MQSPDDLVMHPATQSDYDYAVEEQAPEDRHSYHGPTHSNYHGIGYHAPAHSNYHGIGYHAPTHSNYYGYGVHPTVHNYGHGYHDEAPENKAVEEKAPENYGH